MTCQNSGPNHAHFPVGWHLTILDLLPGGQDLRHGSALVVFPLSFIPVLIKGSYAYCISVKVMTLIGIQCGKGHGIENEKASCDRGHSAWERYESLSRCQHFHPTEGWRSMAFHSQVRAGSGVSRALWFSSDAACGLLGEISEIEKVKDMGLFTKSSGDGCHCWFF